VTPCFTEAWRDFAYVLLAPLVRLVDRFGPRLGLRLKPWVRERQIREKWRS
jgi:hypothetical protein